ncbi:hypothetical protein [Lacunimicrobium album]
MATTDVVPRNLAVVAMTVHQLAVSQSLFVLADRTSTPTNELAQTSNHLAATTVAQQPAVPQQTSAAPTQVVLHQLIHAAKTQVVQHLATQVARPHAIQLVLLLANQLAQLQFVHQAATRVCAAVRSGSRVACSRNSDMDSDTAAVTTAVKTHAAKIQVVPLLLLLAAKIQAVPLHATQLVLLLPLAATSASIAAAKIHVQNMILANLLA